MGIAPELGAVVAEVERGSPAERAGLEAGDVVLSVDGAPVRSSAELRNRIGLVEVDRTVTLDILRDGRRRRIAVKVGAAPAPRSAGAGEVIPELAGAAVGELPPDHPAYGRVEGLLVSRVARGSPAARAGLRRGDIILGVDGRPVRSLEELEEAAPRRPGRVALNLLRGGTELVLLIG
jgi:serine protease Do/serine protease DegQ